MLFRFELAVLAAYSVGMVTAYIARRYVFTDSGNYQEILCGLCYESVRCSANMAGQLWYAPSAAAHCGYGSC